MKIRANMEETQEYPAGEGLVRIEADGLEIFLDTSSLAESLAQIGAQGVVDAIRNTPKPAAESTVKQRRRRGIVSDRMFYATGHLAHSIEAVRVGDATYDIVGPSDRLQDDRIFEMFEKEVLRQALSGPLDIRVGDEIDNAVDDMAKIRKSSSGYF